MGFRGWCKYHELRNIPLESGKSSIGQRSSASRELRCGVVTFGQLQLWAVIRREACRARARYRARVAPIKGRGLRDSGKAKQQVAGFGRMSGWASFVDRVRLLCQTRCGAGTEVCLAVLPHEALRLLSLSTLQISGPRPSRSGRHSI
jgi:hypothetical protein